MSSSQDGSESVDQFLARIASVRDGRDQASEEHKRKMEEDFLKNRKERQARRLERARSLSPAKTGPMLSTPVSQSPAAARDTALNPPVDFSPRSTTLTRSNAITARTSPKLEPKRNDSDLPSSVQNTPSPISAVTGLSRSGTLSWQQRPPRDGSSPRARPLSSIETIRTIPKTEDEPSNDQSEPTRKDIAASLGMKDPAWFRQTQDRGLGSAAYRRNQVEDKDTVEHSVRSQGLPGLSKERSRSSTPSRDNEITPRKQALQLSAPLEEKSKGSYSPSLSGISNAPKLEPSLQQAQSVERQPEGTAEFLTRSDSIRPGRSPSPTKGLGGFVESAMMKRSDSVSKRWSVQANSGLKRGDSIAGTRPLSGARPMHASTLSRNSNRDKSPTPVSKTRSEPQEVNPGGEAQSTLPEQNKDLNVSMKESVRPTSIDSQARPGTPPEEHISRSPSRTLDTRRWSPTKSSWLESALLAKPEAPKPQPAKDETPAWKASLQRNKASRDLSPAKTKMNEDQRPPDLSTESKQQIPTPVLAKKPDSVSLLSSPSNQQADFQGKEKTTEVQDSEKRKTVIEQVERESIVPVLDKPDPTEPGTKEKTPQKALLAEKSQRALPPPVVKPKPQTPPKTDFRSTLKSRTPVTSGDNNAEPEFKAVFGKLKRTQTQNYVAPDTLKHNILTGKAALNVTDGPQKTQRVDEFKESILQKKEAMKTSSIQRKENPIPESDSPKPKPELPEALARRKTLHKATPSVAKIQSSLAATAGQEKPSSIAENKPKPLVSPKPSDNASNVEVHTKARSEQRALPIAPAQQSTVGKTSIDVAPRQRPAPTTGSISAKSPTQTAAELPAGSKLASRLNPNLAALLTRGGSPRPAQDQPSSPEKTDNIPTQPVHRSQTNEDSTTAGELTHMTKGRAKGPKRRAPKNQAGEATTSTTNTTATSIAESKASLQTQPKPSPVKTASLPGSNAMSQIERSDASVTGVTSATPAKQKETDQQTVKVPDKQTKAKPKPIIASKSPELRKVSSPPPSVQNDGESSKSGTVSDFKIATDKTLSQSSILTQARSLPATPKPTSMASPLTPSKSRVNTAKPAQPSVDVPLKPSSPKPIGNAGVAPKQSPSKTMTTRPEINSTPESLKKPSVAAKPIQRAGSNQDIGPIVSAYFPQLPDKHLRAEFDTEQLLLQAVNTAPKMKSTSHNIWEITSDGKKVSMPPQQEHILFEESLYLVVHTYETGSTKASDVYLWCGDGVADAAVEDVQIFCKRDAREHNTKLEVIKQGKEPASFFQALGGILIIRRNKSSSLYMLRGRRHVGHVAFDEVDLSKSNLCSGFPYLVSAKFGKLYLWKGKGSGADEVGCARLIGMDLGLTGEIEEVAEDEEPKTFWDSFPRLEKPNLWSNEWHKRAEHDCYPTTLYRIDLDRPKSSSGFWGLTRAASPPKPTNKVAIEMVSPFCERDVEPTNVYVLDAYRSIYVLLDVQATKKLTETINALHFAQELAMLSPSIQDRSLLPTCFVSFGEPPPDVKVCFRKWSEGKLKSDKPSACLKLEEVMDALKL